ncbi:glycosyltransferase family 4 protein [Methylobacterium frigidaeris]|uniref:D-inositol-3-phosphate glycosyltransferase n=1 Tax=Methylobacterium frigidaeris TaxID=2038277 RepID=A0AA37HFP7_9HYPH|nr:glycosyltransferase family 4 protein [Methylobacterium frigidaeris]PIK69266.1 glycosyl transferase family 1 [Methylobacterium frigidaeris]GJD65030.1 D-inositol-3-phosphate glycosyltransferase [Methylobacterium frigidaeris]
MRVLFVHQNFPGQYRHVAPALAARPGTEVVALGINPAPALPGVRHLRYAVAGRSSPGIHPLAANFETATLRAEAAARAALALKAEGFVPDVICGHSGWGETLFLKDVWPQARLLTFAEFYYSASGADSGFDPEFPAPEDDAFRTRARNAGQLVAFEASDRLVSPTAWQASRIPAAFRDRISVIHDGINTDLLRPDPGARITLGRDRLSLGARDEIVTFVNRNLEPYRGYHSFMRALPEILRRRPKARAVIVGGSDTSYGARPPAGRTWREIFLDEVRPELDLSRVHFVGKIPYRDYVDLLRVSAVHVYLTYPFVLSWSMLEAMALGACIVGSATPPVEEVIRHGENGLLVDFFSGTQIAEAVVSVLSDPGAVAPLRAAARQTALAYDLKRVCLPAHLRLIEAVAAGGG